MLLLWPALLIAVNQDKPKLATLSTGFIAVAAAGAIYAGYSQTAQAALLLSVAVFLIARFWPTFTHWSILSTWCVVVMLAMPIAAAPYSFGLHTYEWIPSSFRDRMIIWDYSVKQATKNPLFGVGIRSIRVIGKELKKSKPAIFEQVAYRRLGLHSHNGFCRSGLSSARSAHCSSSRSASGCCALSSVWKRMSGPMPMRHSFRPASMRPLAGVCGRPGCFRAMRSRLCCLPLPALIRSAIGTMQHND